MGTPVRVPGGRDVAGTLDRPGADAVVIACPPHPRHGGSRSDQRLRAVSEALAPDVSCLRFDYGPWGGGRGERVDAENALRWASERYEDVGLFGYSFGAAVAIRATAAVEESAAPTVLSVLAPPATLPDEPATAAERPVVDALGTVGCPVQIVAGERDDTVDWRPVVERARKLGHAIEVLPADHHFVGQTGQVGETVGPFLRTHL